MNKNKRIHHQPNKNRFTPAGFSRIRIPGFFFMMALAFIVIGCDSIVDQQTEAETDNYILAETMDLKAGPAHPVMVPFKGKGTYQYLDFVPDFVEEQIAITVEFEGTGTHLGHFQGVFTILFEFILVDDMPVPVEYVSHSFLFTAANGDELHSEGSAGPQGPVLEFTEPPGSGFSFSGIPIVGGTDRFENALGEFDFLFSRDPNDPATPGGIGEFEGVISRPAR